MHPVALQISPPKPRPPIVHNYPDARCEKRLKQLAENLRDLEQTVQLIHQTGQSGTLLEHEAKGLLDIITHYTQSFVLLNQFDSQDLPVREVNENITYEIEYTEAGSAIAELKKQLITRKEATELFGNQKDDSFLTIRN